MRKTNIPLNATSRGTPEMPLMIYTLTPTGGVIDPISTITTINTPNNIGSNPREMAIG
jgi:hypothetical protein